jgi:quinoprotein glucose dehydrogenase
MKPPYGRVVAINLNTGDQVWMVPNADGPRDHPALKSLNLPSLGQPIHDRLIVTPTLLLAAQGDAGGEAATPPFGGTSGQKLRAYDKATGAVIRELDLPGGATGGMVTYQHNGRQYILLPVGAKGRPSELIALSLP